MLGFLYYGGTPFQFEPTTSFRPRYPSVGVQSALDARHGRVLLSRVWSVSAREDLVVWDPVRGDLQVLVLPMPRLLYTCRSWTAALLCAAARCDHLDYARGPFRVVLVGCRRVFCVRLHLFVCSW
jgi:hypothetical protein